MNEIRFFTTIDVYFFEFNLKLNMFMLVYDTSVH